MTFSSCTRQHYQQTLTISFQIGWFLLPLWSPFLRSTQIYHFVQHMIGNRRSLNRNLNVVLIISVNIYISKFIAKIKGFANMIFFCHAINLITSRILGFKQRLDKWSHFTHTTIISYWVVSCRFGQLFTDA